MALLATQSNLSGLKPPRYSDFAMSAVETLSDFSGLDAA